MVVPQPKQIHPEQEAQPTQDDCRNWKLIDQFIDHLFVAQVWPTDRNLVTWAAAAVAVAPTRICLTSESMEETRARRRSTNLFWRARCVVGQVSSRLRQSAATRSLIHS